MRSVHLLTLLALCSPLAACGDKSTTESEGTTSSTQSPPTTPSIRLSPAPAYVTDDLTVVFDTESTDDDGDIIQYVYRWSVDGAVRDELTQPTVPASALTQGEVWSVEVTATDGALTSAPATASVTIENRLPAAPTVSLSPVTPQTTDDVFATIDLPETDEDGDVLTLSYQWSVDGTPRPDVVGTTLSAALTAKGETWRIEASIDDGFATTETAAAEVTIENTPPVATIALPATATTVDDLLAEVTVTDADSDIVSYTVSWTVDGAPHSITDLTVSAAETHKGETWVVTVIPNDGETDGAPATAAVVIENTLPTIASVVLTPDPATTTTDLTAVVDGAEDADEDAIQLTYTWTIHGVVIASGPDNILSSDAFVKGDTVVVQVTPNDGAADGLSVDSAALVISNTPPEGTSASLIPTALQESSTATCQGLGWFDADGDPEGWTYEWRVNGIMVGASAYLDGADFDKGDAITCIATPTDGTESGVAWISNTVIVDNTAPMLTSATIAPTNPTESDTLTVNLGPSSDDDADVVTFVYDWTVNGVSVSRGPSIDGGDFEKDDIVAVTVTPTDGTDFGTPVQSAAVTVQNTAPSVTDLTLSPATIATDTVAVAAAAGTDIDGDDVTFTYSWTVNGAWVGSTDDSLDGSIYFEKGDVVEVTATPTDGTDTGTALSATVVVANTAPTAPSAVLSPVDPRMGDDIVCDIAQYADDIDGDTLTYTFAWTVDGAPYTSATTTTLPGDTISGADTNDSEVWACTVTVSDGTDSADAEPVEVLVLDECASEAWEYDGVDLTSLAWTYKAYPSASCTGGLVFTSFGTTTGSTSLSANTTAIDLATNGHYAEAHMVPTVAECPDNGVYTFHLIGRLPTSYQRGLTMTFDFPSGQQVIMDRWTWNGARESSVNVNVYTASGSIVTYSTSNANTGGARNDRPWGWYIGNDGGWFDATLEIDTTANLVTATFAQPSLTSTVYHATYALSVTEGELPDIKLSTWGNCDSGNRVTLDTEILGFVTEPNVWEAL